MCEKQGIISESAKLARAKRYPVVGSYIRV